MQQQIPKTLYIAKHIFALDNRGNINHLYVFQQKKDAGRPFSCKGHKKGANLLD